jgi:hypothetical protein
LIAVRFVIAAVDRTKTKKLRRESAIVMRRNWIEGNNVALTVTIDK